MHASVIMPCEASLIWYVLLILSSKLIQDEGDIWNLHSTRVDPKPHVRDDPFWAAIIEVGFPSPISLPILNRHVVIIMCFRRSVLEGHYRVCLLPFCNFLTGCLLRTMRK